MKKEVQPNGYVVWENDKIVAIATGFQESSSNAKTGELIQIWLIVKQVRPWEAVTKGLDSIICFDCKHMGKIVNGKLEGRDCYVLPFQAPSAIYDAWKNGNYPKLKSFEVFNGKLVRFGAYGEPVLIPFPIVRDIANRARGWTGYTRRWQDPLMQGYKNYFMASCDPENYARALELGWRPFVVRPYKSEPIPGLAICPASEEYRDRFKIGEYKIGRKKTAIYSKPLINCEDCMLCAGSSVRARGIQIENHSQIGKKLSLREAA